MRAACRFLLSMLLCLPLAGCGSMWVRPAGGHGLFAAANASPLANPVSDRTYQTLRNFDLEDAYHDNALDAFLALQKFAEKEPSEDLVFALAEIAFVQGRDVERKDCCGAIPFYYLSAGYAFHYVYGPEGGSPFDPRFRVACELYNASLSKCVRAAQRVGRLDPRKGLTMPTRDGTGFRLSVSHHGFAWKPEEFGTLHFAEDYRAEGLSNRHRTFGLGVTLFATRAAP